MNIGDLLRKRKKEYKSIEKVYCPVLDCDVHFNLKGWRHLRFRGNGHRRTKGDLSRRLSLFPQAKKIISSNKCHLRAECDGKMTKLFLEKGKITVMLRKENAIIYYYSIYDT